jgi:hypothetical protein
VFAGTFIYCLSGFAGVLERAKSHQCAVVFSHRKYALDSQEIGNTKQTQKKQDRRK